MSKKTLDKLHGTSVDYLLELSDIPERPRL